MAQNNLLSSFLKLKMFNEVVLKKNDTIRKGSRKKERYKFNGRAIRGGRKSRAIKDKCQVWRGALRLYILVVCI